MPDYQVRVERVHKLNGNTTRQERSLTVTNAVDDNDACSMILDRCGHMQFSQAVFGDTGMDEGNYVVNILSVEEQ